MSIESTRSRKAARYGVLLLGCLLPALVSGQTTSDLSIAQKPLVLGTSKAPGNLFLVPSIEWPTMNTQANPGSFDVDKNYVGYFNSTNCYVYQYSADATERYWKPVSETTASPASDFTCTGEDQWSGNLLNWAATQNIDPFRRALMGGYRFKDTKTETWLQKAKHSGQGGTAQFSDRALTRDDVIATFTPFDEATELKIRVEGLGNTSVSGGRVSSPMRFWLNGSGDRNSADNHYDPASMTNDAIRTAGSFDAEVRVSVCPDDDALRDDSLCREYPSGNYKPEGLIQEFARLDNEEGFLRFSAFSYLNDSDDSQDGAVLRAGQKFVGPSKIKPSTAETVPNPNAEWDEKTGVFNDNPNPADATNTDSLHSDLSVNRSGVVNYIGGAGQTNTNNYKSNDPLSELFYTMNRYFRNIGPVSAYNNIDSADEADDFPVVTEWDDPLENYSCSANAAVTIGDVFTHDDNNLPGNKSGPRAQEPSYHDELENDKANNDLDVVELTNRVGTIEGSLDGTLGESFFGQTINGSAYIAGLAYDMNTRDQRSDLDGDQRLSTYAIDVFENQKLVPKDDNQYYLAAKYGGFDVPDGFDPDTRSSALPDSWWSSGDDVTIGGTTYDPRPDNYFVANQPKKVAESLREAFTEVATEAGGSSAAVAANSTDASSDAMLYQAQFDSEDWSGDIDAFDFSSGSVPTTPEWQARNGIPDPGDRSVYTIDGSNNLSEIERDEGNVPNGLTSAQETALGSDGPLADYLLFGDSDQELSEGGSFRDRPKTDLGDIVNSAPAVASDGNFGYAVLDNPAGSSYRNFVTQKSSKDDVLYVGANDGMIHAFNAEKSGGGESFAFVPDAVFDDLPALSKTDYSHQKYVDGQVEVADAFWARPTNDWGEVLVASTGGGPKGGEPAVIALDVTRSDTTGAPHGALWELTGSDDSKLGHVLGNMSVVRLNNGEFAAIFGNGYNSDDDKAALFIVPLNDPTSRKVINTGVGSSSNPNGLGGIATVDLEGDGVADLVYGGDLQGNMWRFDLTANSKSSWHTDKLYAASSDRPITAAPRVTPHSQSGVDMNVLFGTGKLFEKDDNIVGSDPPVQRFYSIKDRGTGVEVKKSDLQEQIIVPEDSDGSTRVLSDRTTTADQDGWFLDLSVDENPIGERVVDRPQVVGNRVFFLSKIPNSSVCSFGGKSWLMEMNAETGQRTSTSLVGKVGGEGVNPDIGGVAFDKLAAGLTGIGGDGKFYFAISLSDGTITTTQVPDGGSGLSGRVSWRQLE